MSLSKTIRDAQQELAVNCGYGDNIIWDLFGSADAAAMKDKIKQLIPDQEKGQITIANIRSAIFKNVWAQRKYTNGTSVSSIFYVMVTQKKNDPSTSTKFTCHPVFRCKKCDHKSDTDNCCMIYIDEAGRVYKNWNSYINENVLPPGIMVTPPKGIYNFHSGEVILTSYCTPRGTPEAIVMDRVQNISAVAGLGATIVPLAALVMPVAAPLMATASIVGLGVGAFTAIKSALNLSDRSNHSQSISLTDSQARASYIGVVGGAVGIAAAGATRTMTSMAAAGRATTGIELLVNTMNISSIVLSGGGVLHGMMDLILKSADGEEITKLDVLQLSASLVIFTHSCCNFQLASQIANNAQNKSIKNYRETLSNRQKKMFDKVSKETVRIRGYRQGKMDIIRGFNEIPDRQYLNDLFKVNKQLNQHKVRPAFDLSGKGIVLNNELSVDTGTLRQNIQHQQGSNILGQVTSPIPSTHNSETYTIETSKAARFLFAPGNFGENFTNNYDAFKEFQLLLQNGSIIDLTKYGISFLQKIADGHKFYEIVLSMAENLLERTFDYVMNLTSEFVTTKLIQIETILKQYIPTESVLFHILKHILNKYKNLTYEFISQKGAEILEATKKYFLSLNPHNPIGFSTKCTDCIGSYFICQL